MTAKETFQSQLSIARMLCGLVSTVSVPIWSMLLAQSFKREYGQWDTTAALVTGFVLLIPSLLVIGISVFLLRFSTKCFSILGLVAAFSLAALVLVWPRTVFHIDSESFAILTRFAFFSGIPILCVHFLFATMLSSPRQRFMNQ